MITEDYVSSETAKLLKEKGFKEWCRYCYGLDVRHNGEPIDVDVAYKLRDAGSENEIEYVDGGRMYDRGCSNLNPGSPYAAPTLQKAMKWLRDEKGIAIIPIIYSILDHEKFLWDIKIVVAKTNETFSQGWVYENPESGYDRAIRYCLENLI